MNNLSTSLPKTMLPKTMLQVFSSFPYPTTYSISFEKTQGSVALQRLPKRGQKEFEEHYNKCQELPQKLLKAHLERLRPFYERYADVPEIGNLLTYVYLRLEKREAETLIQQMWERHPLRLTARINYADQLLRYRKKEKIQEVFGGCFDLNLLYPEESHFYFAEFRGFMTLMGFYHLELKEQEKAEECYQLSFQVDPLHPSVLALEKKLVKGLPRFTKFCKLFGI